MKTYTLEELTDNYIGKKGTPKREKFEFELKTDIIGEIIRQTRKEQHPYTRGIRAIDGSSESANFKD